jgi:hypothetical protein
VNVICEWRENPDPTERAVDGSLLECRQDIGERQRHASAAEPVIWSIWNGEANTLTFLPLNYAPLATLAN